MWSGCSRHWTAPALAVNYTAQNIEAVGMTEENCVFMWICSGNRSVFAAMENGQIGKVHHVEYKSEGFFPFFETTTTLVYGEKLTAPRKVTTIKKVKVKPKQESAQEDEEEE